MKNIVNNYLNICLMLFGMSLCFIGTFHEFLSCILSICLIIVLIFRWRKEKVLKVYKNITSITIGAICVMYLISTLWAVDSGMAVIGFFKFMPIFLFLIALMQDEQCIRLIHRKLPYIMAVLTIISFIGMQIQIFEDFFSVAGRMAGTFQYPNSFAIVLLVAELLLVYRKEWKMQDLVVLCVLLVGILLTGSRTVLILAVLANIVSLFLIKNNKHRITLICAFVCIAAAGAIYVTIFKNAELLQRLTQISFRESTFVGRILYVYDALPVILKHPFGTGYMGHYYLQQSIQTGLYSVRFVHNDFVQLALDVGWIPFLMFIGTIGKTILNKNIGIDKKLILVVLCLHCCFDFDLQFIAIFCLLLTFLDIYAGEVFTLKTDTKLEKYVTGISVIFSILCIYIGIALFGAVSNQTELTHKLYPWNTQNELNRLIECDDLAEQKEIADGILKRNTNVVLANSVNARYAYQQGNFRDVIKYKRSIFVVAPFQYEEYEEYCYMLINGISLYEQAGDYESASTCWKELKNTMSQLSEAEKRISNLGQKIDDQPTTRLPLNIQRYVLQREGMYK